MNKNIIVPFIYLVLSFAGGFILAALLWEPVHAFHFIEKFILVFICVIVVALFLLPVLNKYVS